MSNGFVRFQKASGGGGGATTLVVGATPITNGTDGTILFQGTGGLLQESVNLYWDNANARQGIGTTSPLGILHLKTIAQTTRFVIDGDAGQSKIITFRTGGLQRFGLYVNNVAESGSNAGSNLTIRNYNDAGTLIGTPLSIIRANGNVLVNSTTDAGFKLDVNGTTRINNVLTTVGTATSDNAAQSAELGTTASGTNWSGSSLLTGYTHAQGSTTPLTSTLNAISNTYYILNFIVNLNEDYGEGFISSMTFGGKNIPLVFSVNVDSVFSLQAGTSAGLIVTPTSDFNGSIQVSIKTVTTSTASIIYKNSNGITVNELRSSISQANLFFGSQAGQRNIVALDSGASNVFVGGRAGENNVTGSKNTYLGHNAGLLGIAGNDNTQIGYLSGQLGGNFNTFVGSEAGRSITGSKNVSIGYFSGSRVGTSTGSDNIFIGTDTGTNNGAGASNVFIGNTSARNNTSGFNNTFLGTGSGVNNTTGSENVFIGSQAGAQSTTASRNIFIGTEAGLFNVQLGNIYIGYRAGRGTSQNNSDNVYVGEQIGLAQTTAFRNTIMGTTAALNITTQSHMVAIGYQAARFFGNLNNSNTLGGTQGIYLGSNARPLANNTGNEIVVGYNIAGLGSNSVLLGDSAITLTALRGNVVVGTTVNNAAAQLQVDSTTKGFLPPRMDSTQKNAISSPPAGLIIYDTTLNKLCVRTNSAWQTITSA